MNGRYLLDTNIIISLFAKDSQIHNRLSMAEEVFVPCVAVGELYYGAYKALKQEENLARLEEFALNNTVLPCDTSIAKRYGDIKNRLKKRVYRFRIMIFGLLQSLNNMLLHLSREIPILRLLKT